MTCDMQKIRGNKYGRSDGKMTECLPKVAAGDAFHLYKKWNALKKKTFLNVFHLVTIQTTDNENITRDMEKIRHKVEDKYEG